MTDIDYNLLSEEEQIKNVSREPSIIRNINNPSDNVVLEAVKNDGLSIYHTQNPDEKLQLESLKSHWYRDFYESYVKDLPNKTEWFQREFNRLKLIKGPLKND